MNRLEYIKSMIGEGSNDPFLYFALAKECEKLENYEAAREQYEYLTKHHPDYVGTYYHLGKLYESLGLKDEALSCYNLGVEVAGKQGDEHAKSELMGARQLLG